MWAFNANSGLLRSRPVLYLTIVILSVINYGKKSSFKTEKIGGKCRYHNKENK